MNLIKLNSLTDYVHIIRGEKSVKQKSIKTYKKKTNLKTSLNNLEKIE